MHRQKKKQRGSPQSSYRGLPQRDKEKERGSPQKERDKEKEKEKELKERENIIEVKERENIIEVKKIEVKAIEAREIEVKAIELRETPKEDNESNNKEEIILGDDEVYLAEVVVDSVRIPVSMHSLNKVKINEWINDEVVDALIYRDVIRNHESDKLLVSSVVWDDNFNPQVWNSSNKRVRNRLPTIPYHSTTFSKAIIPININNIHWAFATLDKESKTCTYYCTLGWNLDNFHRTKLLKICSLLCRSECEFVIADKNTFQKQNDSYNCGPMICILIERLLNNKTMFFRKTTICKWRNDVYNHYNALHPKQNNTISTNKSGSNIVINNEPIVNQTKPTNKGKKRMSDQNDENVPKKFLKISENSNNEMFYDKSLEKSFNDSTCDKLLNLNFESQKDEDDLMEINEVAKINNLKNKEGETFKDYCKRLNIKSKNSNKAKAQHRRSQMDAKEKLKELESIKEKKKIYRETRRLELSIIEKQRREKLGNRINHKQNDNRSENRETYNSQQKIHKINQKEKTISTTIKIAGTDITTFNIVKFNTGIMDLTCEKCSAKHFKGEVVTGKKGTFDTCCGHGEVEINFRGNFPDFLIDLLNGNHLLSKNFFENIRKINNDFALASLQVNLVNFATPGPYCFKIHGQVCHNFNIAAFPNESFNPTHGQLFIIDEQEALRHRENALSNVDSQIITQIEQYLRKNNRLAQLYRMMKDEIETQKAIAEQNGTEMPDVRLALSLKPGQDKRRFNLPVVDEIAAIFTTDADGNIPEAYVMVYNTNEQKLKRLSTMDPNVEAMVYPLFYPNGEIGWQPDLKRKTHKKRISRGDYIRYQMRICDKSFNPFIHGKRLFQQWVVDNYVKIERDRLNFVIQNQQKLKVELYSNLMDYLHNAANDNEGVVGRTVILPSTFSGSPRMMLQIYNDAMAIYAKTGKPDLFITMTCNPNCESIKHNIEDGQTASDRPDIVARVFKIQVDELLDDLTKKKIFGLNDANIDVIEIQKRGLPHTHILLTLKPGSKLTTAELVDKFISAELPDPEENPELFELVKKHMIHNECGSRCMINGKCSKNFPKEFAETTTLNEDGYPNYKRPNNGRQFVLKSGFVIDNRRVVPYNPYLLLKYNCHINVEVVASIKAVKYLYKYVYKGHDSAGFQIEANDGVIEHDETKDYQEGRYVSPVEACWRINKFSMQGKSHAVTRLPIHLPNAQSVFFNDDCETDKVEALIDKPTLLTDYFELNKRNPKARNFLYNAIPEEFRWRKPTKDDNAKDNFERWYPRKNETKSIGRMYSISPAKSELFHLRILLLNVKGANSFEDLKTFEDKTFQTFQEACLARGLISDDSEWEACLREGAMTQFPNRLRSLFVRILIHCQPVYPQDLWEMFKIDLSHDYIRRYGEEEGCKRAYHMIDKLLRYENLSLADFPTMEQIHGEGLTDEDFDMQSEALKGQGMYDSMNEAQKTFINEVVQSIDSDDKTLQKLFYIDGPGGSGKTYTYKTLYHIGRGKGKKIALMAFTGIAPTLLPNGKTVHKTFGLPVPLYSDSSSSISARSQDGKQLIDTDIFIWDEAPAAPKHALEVADRLLRDLTKIDEPFGGKIFILGGDFRQALPIKKHGTKSETIDLSIKFSYLWKLFKIYNLTQNMRADPNEIEFSQFLLNLGNGTLNDKESQVEIPQRCITKESLTQVIYGEDILSKDFKSYSQKAILAARNVDVDKWNDTCLDLLDSHTEKIYPSIDTVKETETKDSLGGTIPTEYLNSLNPASLPLHQLRLRQNAIVMLIRNQSIREGLCNGTRLRIINMHNRLLECEVLTGDNAGDIVFIPRISLIVDNLYPFALSRRQFPIRLAFAMTINKAQGQTFKSVGIDLSKDVFTHGQVYVAMSRVKNWESLKISFGDKEENKTLNPVFHEVLM